MAASPTPANSHYVLALMRLGLGVIFLWAFLDKLIGLGFSTCRQADTNAIDLLCSQAWLSGGSPTYGFLTFATKGPFVETFQSMAGNPAIDILFMLGLAGIGLALIAGVAIKIATLSGAIMMFLMWGATLWPANNPILDEHIIYALSLWVISAYNQQQKLGLGQWWQKTDLVKKFAILQ